MVVVPTCLWEASVVTEVAVPSPQEVVHAMYEKLGDGALEEARALWSDSGVWHVTGSHPLAGDYNTDEYFSFVQRFLRAAVSS